MTRFANLLLCLAATLLLIVGPPPRSARAEPPAVRVSFDDRAVRDLLDLMVAKDASDASLDRWLDLPANRNLLRVGALEGTVTREQLKERARALIEGKASPQRPDDPARLVIARPETYRKMLDDLKATADGRSRRIADRVRAFSPEVDGEGPIDATVYLHLAGTWDAINHQGAIYLNLYYWHDYNRPGWDGLNMIVAHETMHSVQNRAYGNPEDQETGEGSFLTALSKIQREGTARYVEVETDPEPYAEYTYGFFYRAVDQERLRAFARQLPLLAPLTEACYPTFDRAKFAETYTNGMDSGGPFYVVGHGIAKAIDEKMGRAALLETVARGPKDFFGKYLQLCEKDTSLPPLPERTAEAVRKMKERL